MNIDQSRIDELIARPSESLNVEVKRWISPDEPSGIAKIVRAAFALRNRNGGYLIVGFDDKTLQPDLGNEPPDVKAAFHADKVQGLISRYASDQFEVGVAFGKRDGREYPVIVIPEGVRSPVAAKSDLSANSKSLIRVGDVYFRTLASNGTASTATARYQDWREIVETCFDNREADVGRFLRRQLAARDVATLVAALSQLGLAEITSHAEGITKQVATGPSLHDQSIALLDDGEQRFEQALAARSKFGADEKRLIKAGSWSVALVIDPPRTGRLPDKVFLSTLASSNPQYTGWPVWLDASDFRHGNEPKVVDKAWEALIFAFGMLNKLDFLRLDPAGKFYLRRNLPDDVSKKVAPRTLLDPVIVISRVAEAIAVGLAFAGALGWEAETTRLGFAFRWTKLRGRELESWDNSGVLISAYGDAHDDEVTTCVKLSLDTPASAIAPLVDQATQELFVLFGGYRLPSTAIEHWVQRLVERKL